MLYDQWHRAPGRRRTVGADKGYDTFEFVELTRELRTTPHVAQNLTRPGDSALDARTRRHESYAMSQHARPRIEPTFGWSKTIAWILKVRLRRPGQGRLALRLCERGVQLDPVAQVAAEAGMMQETCPRPVGRRRRENGQRDCWPGSGPVA